MISKFTSKITEQNYALASKSTLTPKMFKEEIPQCCSVVLTVLVSNISEVFSDILRDTSFVHVTYG